MNHNRHPIARPSGRAMGCVLWVEILFDVMSKSLTCCMKYHVISDRVITASDWTLTICTRHIVLMAEFWSVHYVHFKEIWQCCNEPCSISEVPNLASKYNTSRHVTYGPHRSSGNLISSIYKVHYAYDDRSLLNTLCLCGDLIWGVGC